MLQLLADLEARALGELDVVTSTAELDGWRVRYLGRKSQLTQFLRQIAALPLEEKKTVGARANDYQVAPGRWDVCIP
jgi:phenylalanyl-tRNA synthetase alpha chain